MSQSTDAAQPGNQSQEIGAGYIDRLALDWPEPREQLHHGGWAMTRRLIERLNLTAVDHVLDICCGEGGTSCWLAQEHGLAVIGVDIVPEAVQVAQRQAAGLPARFAAADVFHLPLASARFDVVIGQDPDGLAPVTRTAVFREIWRVLRPGGRLAFHHWVVYDDVPLDLQERLDTVNAVMGFPSMRRITVGAYLGAMHAAGFPQVRVEDNSAIYADHLRRLAANVTRRRGADAIDPWTRLMLDLYDAGYRAGATFITRKPD